VEQDRAPPVLSHHEQLAWSATLTREVVVNLIGNVSTTQGLKVRAELDENVYEAGIKVSDAELAEVAIERDEFHGEWNYRIKPRQSRRET
jgi:hypothetical protein